MFYLRFGRRSGFYLNSTQKHKNTKTQTHTHTHTYTFFFLWWSVLVNCCYFQLIWYCFTWFTHQFGHEIASNARHWRVDLFSQFDFTIPFCFGELMHLLIVTKDSVLCLFLDPMMIVPIVLSLFLFLLQFVRTHRIPELFTIANDENKYEEEKTKFGNEIGNFSLKEKEKTSNCNKCLSPYRCLATDGQS